MTTPKEELERLVRGLTEAQRRAVLGAREGLVVDYWWFSPMRSATRRALDRKGLTVFSTAPDRLSSLGLVLRAHILEQETGHA